MPSWPGKPMAMVITRPGSAVPPPGTLQPAAQLVICIVIVCLLNLIWIHLNAAPPRSWDDAEYLADSVSTYHALERGELTEFLRAASRPARGVHPPMTKLLPIPMYALLGPGTKPALYAYTLLIPVFCVYVFLLGTAVSGSRRIGVLAVVVTCGFPLTFGLWRLVMAEFGLAVAVVAAQYHLYRCAHPGPSRAAHAMLAGAFIGLGLLWKVSLPVFVVGPVCYLLVRTWRFRSDRLRPSQGRVILLMAAAAACVAGPFYVLRSAPLWGFVLYNSSPSAELERFALGPVLSAGTVLKYWTVLAHAGTSPYFFVLGAALLGMQVVRRKWPLPPASTWFVASCAVVPLVFFSFQYLKEPRHLFPAFAMFGILVAAMLTDSLAPLGRKARVAALTAVLAFPVYQFAWLSFDIPWGPASEIRLGPLQLLAADRDSLFVRPANSTAWPVEEIVGRIAAQSQSIEGRAPRIRVAGHVPFLNGPVLHYESLLRHRQPLAYSMVGDRSLHPTWWDFLVVLAGPVAQPDSEHREPVLERLLENRQLPFTLLGRVALPDSREAVLYRASSTGPLSASASGGNLVTATARDGEHLFPVSRAEWDLPAGRTVVAVASDERPIEFAYVYVPESTAFLSWQVVRSPQSLCVASEYAVTVFDLNSRRGPVHTVSKTFRLSAAHAGESASLDMSTFQGQIVAIRLSSLSTTRTPPACLGWSDLRIVDPGLPERTPGEAHLPRRGRTGATE
jgi:hypothetical protein